MKFLGLILAILLLIPSHSDAGQKYRYKTFNNQDFRVLEKVIEFGEVLKIIGIPVTDTDTEYYYQKSSSNGNLSDEDVGKIATAVVDEFERRLGNLDGGGNAGSEVELKAVAIINEKCAACHNANDHADNLSFITDGRLDLHDYSEVLKPSELAWLMHNETLSGEMPKGGPPLTPEEVETFRELAILLTKNQRQGTEQ